MKLPLSWLFELVETELSAAEIAARLTGAGIEVEGIEERGRELDGIVVGEIVTVDPHPGADRLVVCQVRLDGGRIERIVCGARNMRAGDRVAVATPGTSLPDGRRIEAAEVRGVVSNGMLCSEKELGLGDDHEGILIVAPTGEVGAPLARALGMADTIFEISLTPNRGDCLSVLGIARELASLQAGRLVRRGPALRHKGARAEAPVTVRIADADLCWRYAARVVSGVAVGPSPLWMQQRLLAAGMRPINNVVDVTNYVMLERGQPLHAFDLDRLAAPEIVVRRAGDIRRFMALDGTECALEADDLLITSGGLGIAIAGVMGGVDSGVSASTRTVLLESAWFLPATVRRTSKRLGMSTESAYRFERHVDVEGVMPALERAAGLLVREAGGAVESSAVDVYPRPYRPPAVKLRVPRVSEMLGVNVERSRIVAVLKAIGAEVSSSPGGVLTVVPPSHRSDLAREIDLVEEVARLVGYDAVPTSLPVASVTAGQDSMQRIVARELRSALAAMGWSEIVPLSFVPSDANAIFPGLTPDGAAAVAVVNPITTELPELRKSLLAGLVDAARVNARQGENDLALFACGNAFWLEGSSETQALRFAGLLSNSPPRRGVGLTPAQADFYDLKGVVENILERFSAQVEWSATANLAFLHPGLAARITLGSHLLGYAGALHPDLQAAWELPSRAWAFELDLAVLLDYPPRRSYRELPRFPAVIRDLAIVAEEGFVAGEVVRFVRESRSDWIEAVELFDQYRGAQIPPGKKSLAFSIVYRAADRTLTDDEVNSVHERLTEDLTRALGVELRR